MSQTTVTTPVSDQQSTYQVGAETIIPIIEETIRVDKRVIEQGGFRIVKSVSTEDVVIEEPTIHEAATVDRVAVNRLLEPGEELPKSRRDGDTLIIPIFEEVIVTEKRMRVTEELHVVLSRTETVTPQSTTIRRESVRIEPLAPSNDLRSTQD